jgi:hypothetical protein
MKNKLQLLFAFIGLVTIGNAQTCTDTIKYVNYKSKLVLNAGKNDSVNYLGKLKLKEGVAQSFINKDQIDVNGAVVRMSAQNFSFNKYTPATSPMKVKVYLETADEFDFHPLKRIDSVEVMVLKDTFYTVKFSKATKIDGHFSISVVNAQSDAVRPRIYATNSTVLNDGYGEAMGFVITQEKTTNDKIVEKIEPNISYFDNSVPSATTGYGFTSGGEGELIDWDYLIYPIISYDITPSITSTNPTPDNNGEVELTRMNALTIGSNHMLSLSGFNKKYFEGKDTTYVWKVKGKVSLDSVYNFTYFTGDDLGSFTVKVKGYTSNCSSVYLVKTLNLVAANAISALNVYPNPLKETLTVSFTSTRMNGSMTVRLLDFSGKLIHSEELDGASSNFETHLSVADLYPGMYLLEIENAGNRVVRKLIKE